MQAIYFEENEEEIWNKFIAENCSESFLQSWEWGNFQESLGYKIWRIGIIDNNLHCEEETNKLQITDYEFQINSKFKIQNSKFKILAAALVVKHNLPFGRSYFYCPRGPAINKFKVQSSKFKVLDLLFDEIKKIAKKEGAMFLRIDPPADWNGESGIWNLENSGFVKSPNEIQPRDTLILDLTKSEEELLKGMRPKTRYNVRLAERKKLEIRNWKWEIGKLGSSPDKKSPPYDKEGRGWLRCENQECFKKDFEEFWELMGETSKRDGFRSHSKDYYWKMLESLGSCNREKLSSSCHCEEHQRRSNPVTMPEGHNIKSIPNNLGIASALKSLAMTEIPERLQAKLYLAEYENKIIAANIVLYFGDLAVYLHGASSSEYRNLMAPYLLQWRQIMDAKNEGYKKYDFWGIKGSSKFKVNSKFNSWSGITRFKKGFGGGEKNYIGAYDAVFDNIGYAIYKPVKHLVLSIKY